MIEIRLQKFLSNSGVASRRKSEEYILAGLIKVNDKVVTELGTKINPEKDIVKFENNIVKIDTSKVYFILNKPTGFITSRNDEKGRKTILDLLDIDKYIYPVGRLDYDSSGLILLTNDGEITNKILHPKNKIPKTYQVKVSGFVNTQSLNKLRNGVYIDGYKTSKSEVNLLYSKNDKTSLEITIYEGKNRQVRKMFESIGNKVIDLKRIKIGKISIGNLKSGKYRSLSKEELLWLKKII